MDMKARNKEMWEMRRGGATHQEIGDKFGISRERVGQILGRKGYLSPMERYPQIVEHIRECPWKHDKAISRDLGISVNKVYRVRKQMHGDESRERRSIAWFWHQIDKTDSCWLWTGNSHIGGFGKVNTVLFGRKNWFAHRLAYTLVVGEIPEGGVITQACGNKLCCNPDHLRLVFTTRPDCLDLDNPLDTDPDK